MPIQKLIGEILIQDTITIIAFTVPNQSNALMVISLLHLSVSVGEPMLLRLLAMEH